MDSPEPTLRRPPYERYLPYRRWAEIGFWVLSCSSAAVGNAITVGMEMRRAGLVHHPLEPALWEASSALMLMLLIPALVWFTGRFPLQLDSWRRLLPIYLLGSLVYCLVHVVGMVLVRQAVYQLAGDSYDFGHWGRQLFYEYVKDVRSFLLMVLIIEGYRLLLRRLQGEASLLGAPDDDAPPVEPVDRPERFLVRKLGRDFLVKASDIESLQAAGNYVNLRVRGREYPLRSTIAAIEARRPASSRWTPATRACISRMAAPCPAADATEVRCANGSSELCAVR
jgi:uncharacterized membrane protein